MVGFTEYKKYMIGYFDAFRHLQQDYLKLSTKKSTIQLLRSHYVSLTYQIILGTKLLTNHVNTPPNRKKKIFLIENENLTKRMLLSNIIISNPSKVS